MAEATSFFRWRPHPWHGLEVVYGRDHALKVVNAAMEDYEEAFC